MYRDNNMVQQSISLVENVKLFLFINAYYEY